MLKIFVAILLFFSAIALVFYLFMRDEEVQDFNEIQEPTLEQDCLGYGIEPEITSVECEELGGNVFSNECCKEDFFLGTITDLRCPCICCIEDVD